MLDNVIWDALHTYLAHLGVREGGAARFHPNVTSLAGVAEETPACFEQLASLVEPGQRVGMFLRRTPAVDAFDVELSVPLLQMVRDGAPITRDPRVGVLGPGDAPDMMALAALTKPGPFGPRTHELSGFVGIREDGELVAMAGQRLRIAGHTELTAICTHPRALGRGYGAAVMGHIIGAIVERGERPFLHCLPDNARAVALYERMGFLRSPVERRYVILARTGAAT